MTISWTLLFLVGVIQGRPQVCDPIFDTCSERQIECDPEDIFADCNDVGTTPCDPDDVFAECNQPPPSAPEACFDSTKEIENAIFSGDTRQAFNDCDPTSSCDKYGDEGYVCAPSWTCKNNTIITDGKGLIDVRNVDFSSANVCEETSGTLDASDSKCDKIDHVCCKKPNFRATRCTPLTRETKTGDEINEYARCGRSSPTLTITGQASNSQEAQPGEFPHMCVVYRFEQGQRIYVGGASLIARNKVMTVAHKFFVVNKGKTTDWRDSASDFQVRCGEHNVKTETELLDSQETEVQRIILHPQYDAKRVYNNLAILQTKENFVYQKHIGPVCLPSPQQNFDNEENCWSSGWGADAYDSYAQFSDSLKKVKMPVVPSSECERRMKNTDRFRNKPGFRIHDSWICVGGEEGSDTCKGDGGSPHVCKNSKDEWVQVGAVAWGVGCGDEVPSVYSSIPAAMCWIDWVMSCVPIAEYDIDNTFVEDLDIRGTSVESKNKLTTSDCGDWMQNSFDLKDICEVSYQDIDERIFN
eukprot:TRINITY_DN2728_c0_g1_i9.p1 TRINITY_DN2728_c0_g1~~TRINITY_DN2728_c0_g1_i9.p1  ORF type:complete len:527 (-),score=114.06 TRINITY_DN2728_c0_g1_i9:161-1741(-)